MKVALLFFFLLTPLLSSNPILTGAQNSQAYLPQLLNKRVAVVANHASRIEKTHLVDFLLQKKINIKKIFTPEHGFRGNDDAGAHVKNAIDKQTKIPLISLYGKNKKPSINSLKDVDIILFDLQDVGVRFYTYLSTLHYVMEAAAQQNIPLILLDRPNPNAHYIDGPVLQEKYKSFVGLHPVPLVYGMTIGEYAKMINGQKWLKNSIQTQLTVIALQNYTHERHYTLPLKPSPNLPTQNSILLYPSLALMEGTPYSLGRGTSHPFESYGNPLYPNQEFYFIPKSKLGAKYPKHKNKKVFGKDLRVLMTKKEFSYSTELNLSYLLDAYSSYPNKKMFFLKGLFFDKLAGTNKLRLQLISGVSEKDIRKSWRKDLVKFQKIREKYLIYP